MKKRKNETAFCLLLAGVLLAGIGLAISNKEEVKTETMEYVVQAGDTLWDIAEEYAPDMNISEYIHNVKVHNRLETVNLYPDMVLEIEREVE